MLAAMNPATSIFQGVAGTMAANIRMMGPTQVIIGFTSVGANQGWAQWISTPIPNALITMNPSERSITSAGSRRRARTNA